MPALPSPESSDTIPLPPRRARVAAETDVLIVGGGPAGIGAALGAAMSGVKVVLAERYGFLGGSATAALVTIFMSYYTRRPRAEQPGSTTLLPTDHGGGEPVIEGVLKTLVNRMVERGGAIPPSPETGFVVPFDPEVLKLVTLELLDEAGVQFLLHSLATGVIGEGKLEGVVFETKSGPLAIKAKTVVDCTGDGDIAEKAGAPFQIGRAVDGSVQPMTLMFTMGEFNKNEFEGYVRRHPDQWHGVHGLRDLVQDATEAEDLELEREDVLFFATPHRREVSVNSTRVIKVLGTNVWDLTYAESEGRRQMGQIAAFLRRYVPGFEKAHIAQSGSTIGVRETRRIMGEYQLTIDDILTARKFDDVIARGSYPIDIHNPDGAGTTLKQLPPGEAYDIPLRCLIPRGTENLLVAGRCISGTHEAHSSYRVMPIAIATGQAAGVCAAIAARAGRAVRDIPTWVVQDELILQGANLGAGLESDAVVGDVMIHEEINEKPQVRTGEENALESGGKEICLVGSEKEIYPLDGDIRKVEADDILVEPDVDADKW
ncbi:MAG: FAD-dependent oxidoreductase [bacterium]